MTQGAFFALFFGAGLATTYLTTAKKGLGALVMATASIGISVYYYLVIASTISASAHGASADAIGTFGEILGLIVAVVAFFVSLVGGIVGALVGDAMKKKASAAPVGAA